VQESTEPLHDPPEQLSYCVQALPSSQEPELFCHVQPMPGVQLPV